MKLTDISSMPFGKHSGEMMETVPANYLLWLWDEAGLWDRRAIERERGARGGPGNNIIKRLAVHDYIRENFRALETECMDRIVQHQPGL
jgi:hypothetical protein